MKNKHFLILVLILSAVLLVACSSSSARSGTQTPSAEPSKTPRPTRTPLPTQTSLPSPTPTLTLTPTITLPPTSTPEMDYSQVKLYTQGFLPRFNYFFAFKFPKEIKGSYHAVVDVNKPYKCEIMDPKFPARLTCWGPLVRVLDYTLLDLYAGDTSEPIFSAKIFIPDFGQ